MSGFRKAAPSANIALKSRQSSAVASSSSPQPIETAKTPGISFSFGGSSSANNNAEGKPAGNSNTGKVSFALGVKKNGSGGATLKGHSHKRRRSASPAQLITVFGAGGGTDEKEEEKKVLVIPAIENRNWIQETMKRRGIYRPVGQLIDAERNREADEQEKKSQQARTYGLTLTKRESSAEDDRTLDAKESEGETVKDAHSFVESSGTVSVKKETQDERVIRQLISEFSEDDRKKSNMVLPISLASTGQSAAVRQQQMSEEDAYKLDIVTRPDEPTLQDYEAVPVEEFGFALLRGMGWKEGEGIGRNRKRVRN
ncbi:DExH-box splicing factor binding site-domain-containing protein [Lipomyces chichibuensis]|uniref:DExH-box splicing factor binding site-domain-containing protein n=1 Tax=Lipomyces chichibuensis TaxID=1546026 RepID=UPI003344107B